jgi:hypothetical protein
MHVLYNVLLRKTVQYRILYPTPFKSQTSSTLVPCVPSPLKRHQAINYYSGVELI